MLSKQLRDKFNKKFTKSMNDNKIDNEEYIELLKLYEEYKRDKKSKLSIFFKLKLLVFSYNCMFSNNIISINEKYLVIFIPIAIFIVIVILKL